MSNDDSTQARPRTRRMLPAVGEVMREASARTNADPELVFKAARQVCSDELRRIKEGQESVPVETLVQRTLALVQSVAPRSGRPGEEEVFSETTGALDLQWEQSRGPFAQPKLPPLPPLPVAPSPAPLPPTEEAPFAPLEEPAAPVPAAAPRTGVAPSPPPPLADPFAATALLPLPGEEAPFAQPAEPEPSESLPLPEAATEIYPAVVMPAPPVSPSGEVVPKPESLAMLASEPFTLPETVSPAAAEGFGEDTLGRLSREAASVDLASVLPKPQAGQEGTDGSGAASAGEVPYAIVVSGRREGAVLSEEDRFERSDLESPTPGETPRRRPWPFVAAAAAVVAAVALGWYGFGLIKKPSEPPQAPLRAPERRAKPPAPRAETAPEAPAPTQPPAAVPALATPVPTAVPATAAPPPTVPQKAEAPAAARPTAPPLPDPVKRAAPAAPVPAAAPTAVVTRIELPKAAPAAAAPAPASKPAPTTAPVVPTKPVPAVAAPPARPSPASAPAVKPTAAPVVAPAPAQAAPAAAPTGRQGRAAPLLTPDWAGKEPVFAVHFSSYPDRKTADKDAAAIGKRLGTTAYTVEVDLGPKGTWYRVVAGEFGSFAEATAFRDDVLAGGKVDKVGFVYRLEAAKAAPR